MKRIIFSAMAGLLFFSIGGRGWAQSRPETIEWTWEVRPAHANPTLPNVLIEGDSIARSYFTDVQQQLNGVANVYLMASSICVDDPRLAEEIASFGQMEGVRFRVVHFNNGMHGWQYTEDEYKAGFPAFLAALQRIAPGGTFIWATITPVKADTPPEATNARIDARNAIALTFVHGMQVDDLHGLMLQHQDLHMDNVHFNPQGAGLMAGQVAGMVRQALGSK